jgi:Tol biopolymer transport system component
MVKRSRLRRLLWFVLLVLLSLQPASHAQDEPTTSRIYFVEASIPQPISDVYGLYDHVEVVDGNVSGADMLLDFRIGGVTQLPQWSPDGEQMVFAHKPPYVYSASGYLADQVTGYRVGHGWHEILLPLSYIYGLSWSPDGTQLAFYSGPVNDAPSCQFEVMEADGSNRRVLADGPVDFLANVAWSPDGRQLAVLSSAGGQRSVLQIVDIASASVYETAPITRPSLVAFTQWTPDGKTILLGDEQVYNVAEDRFDRLPMANDDIRLFSNLILSPDGTQLAAITLEDALVVWDYASGELLVSIPVGDYAPDHGNLAWSPDSTQIALSAITEGSEFAQIYVANIGSGTLQQASFSSDMHAIVPQWRPYTPPTFGE